MALLDEAASLAALQNALERLVRNRAGPGPDGITIEAFHRHAREELARLQSDLLSGAWAPRPARQIRIPKPGGGYRNLALSCVRDRVVQHSLASTLSFALDEALHPCAFAWRKGRSTHDALRALEEHLSEGNHWVFRGDIEEFFDRIAPKLLLATLEEVTAEPALLQVVERLLSAGILSGAILHDPLTGTGQGSPLSPFLANLYLVPFDRAMEREGFSMIRYGDDLCVPGFVKDEVTAARDCAATALKRLRLTLNPLKLAIRHRGEGFVFLGFQFDAEGRRPCDKARRILSEKLEATLRERPQDGHEEVSSRPLPRRKMPAQAGALPTRDRARPGPPGGSLLDGRLSLESQ